MNNNIINNVQKIALATLEGTYYFTPQQIVRLQSVRSYTRLYFTDHKAIVISRILKEYENLLKPFGFIRTHRSHLVNKSYIASIDTQGNVVMQDESKAAISRRKKCEVMKALRE